MKAKNIPDYEFSMELDHPGLQALILLPYRDADEWEPKVRRWVVSDGEEIPVDPTLFMMEKLLEDYQADYPEEEWSLEILEEGVRIGEAIVLLLRGD